MASAMKQIAVEREDARQRVQSDREKFEREKDLWKRQMLMVSGGVVGNNSLA